jgi:hypothetical protein
MQDERAARYSDLFASRREHSETSDCAYCPICTGIAVVRNTKPEVLDHLASAVRELVSAAAILLEEAEKLIGPQQEEPDQNNVRHIDIG